MASDPEPPADGCPGCGDSTVDVDPDGNAVCTACGWSDRDIEGCPDCHRDTVVDDPESGVICTSCGWRD